MIGKYKIAASEDVNGRKPKPFSRKSAADAILLAYELQRRGHKKVRIIDAEGRIYTHSLFAELEVNA